MLIKTLCFAVLMTTTLAAQQSKRTLVVFAESPTDPTYCQQLALFEGHDKALLERDLLIFPIFAHGTPAQTKPLNSELFLYLGRAEAAEQRRGLHPGPHFTVILVGKDGGEKLRSSTPLTVESLTQTIDAMPMRKDEVRDRQK